MYFIKQPIYCEKEIYQSSIQKILQGALEIKNVAAVFQIGNISSPGISDLDIVIVLRGNDSLPNINITKRLTCREKYVLMHGIFVVPVSFWQHRHFFYIYDNLKHLWGDDFSEPTIDPSPEFRLLLRKRFAIQHIIKVYVSICAQQSVYSLKVRPLLCELHALRYDEQVLFDWLTPELQTTFRQYCQNIARLRKNWFDLYHTDARQQLLTICRELPPFLYNILIHLNLHLEPNKKITQSDLQQPLKLSYHRNIICGNSHVTSINGSNPYRLRWLGLFPVPIEKLRIKTHNRLSAFHLEIPKAIFNFVSNEFNHPLYMKYLDEIEIRQKILDMPIVLQIRKKGYAFPALDFFQ